MDSMDCYHHYMHSCVDFNNYSRQDVPEYEAEAIILIEEMKNQPLISIWNILTVCFIRVIT